MPKPFVNLLLDSGAFSAWTLQEPIRVKDYIAFVKEYQKLFWGVICLDQLPGKFGQARTQKDVDIAAKASYKNLQTMKDAGLRPIPVFHRGENWSWLEQLIKDGESYIGLSPLTDTPEHVKRPWLDQCFSILSDGKNKPLVKTHGFGVTNPRLMLRYPWYSVDSTAWVKAGGFGYVRIPARDRHGKPDFSLKPVTLHISDNVKAAFADYARLGEYEKKVCEKFFEECGFSLAEMIYSRPKRCEAMLVYFTGLEKLLPRIPKTDYRPVGFFKAPVTIKPKPKPADAKDLASKFFLFHSTQMGEQAGLLTRCDIHNRLLSYFELRKMPQERIAQYVMDGMERRETKNPSPRWDWRGYTAFRRMQLMKRMDSFDSEDMPS